MQIVKQGGIKYHFFLEFGMTWPGIEPRSPGPLSNTQLIRPMARSLLLIQNVFLIQDEKGSVFIIEHEEQKEKLSCKAFEQIIPSNLFVFRGLKRILPGSDGELTEQPLSQQDVRIMIKTKHPINIMVFRIVTSDDNVIHHFHFSLCLRISTQALQHVPWGDTGLRLAVGRPYVSQMDSVPCHPNRRT